MKVSELIERMKALYAPGTEVCAAESQAQKSPLAGGLQEVIPMNAMLRDAILSCNKKHAPIDVESAAMTLPDSHEVRTITVRVTPTLAAEWLRRNRNNRKLTPRRVKQYAEHMLRGEWRYTGEAIRFSKTGALIDGQHRLHALIESGIDLRIDVVTGLDDDVFDVLDAGKSRTGADILSIHGLDSWQSGTAASAIQMALNARDGLHPGLSARNSNREVSAFWLDHPSFAESVEFLSRLPRHANAVSHSVGVYLHWEFAKRDRDLADQFMAQLFHGDQLARTSPIYVLRQKFLSMKLANTPADRCTQVHGCIKAWNLIRERKPVSGNRSVMPRSDEALPGIK